MAAELHHRVRNTLATVKAVLEATLDSSADPDEFRQAFGDRIASLAKAHAQITADEDQAVPFEELLRSELEAYEAPGRRRVSLRGPPVLLASEQAVPLGMTLHELTVNAIRHGSLRDPNGRFEVRWSVEEGPTEQVLHWTWGRARWAAGRPADARGFRHGVAAAASHLPDRCQGRPGLRPRRPQGDGCGAPVRGRVPSLTGASSIRIQGRCRRPLQDRAWRAPTRRTAIGGSPSGTLSAQRVRFRPPAFAP